ncbi:outer membrane beta-barrel protein [Dyadobacter sandarakinus]|uniref:Outer membrane beta-barrel protein n=1 Tax=Dyadobacter sandarakinus TaxID=2747268 RepID=A0ABX7I6P8_9BACT|nr:outer membrane beta-barrel protein [Dyadobacter sandarakinus]QRR01781.1 outer membrane beta-barrel protein [Dyadobacter sandarakinus]
MKTAFTSLLVLFAMGTVMYAHAQDAPIQSEWRKERDAETDAKLAREQAGISTSRWNFGVNGGYAYRLFRSGVRKNPDQEKYIKDLKSGISFGGDLAYFPWRKIGIGAVYDYYTSKATAADGLSEDVTIQFYGGSLIHRANLKNNRSFIRTALLMGYQPYQNKTVSNASFTISGKTVGWGVSVGVEQKLSDHLAIHLTGTALLGAAYRIERATGINKETLHLGKDNSVDLSRASLTLGLRFL